MSHSGAAFTWAGNSRENRLTPFANDPLTDPTGEAFYLRDEDSGVVWGATPAPLPRRADGGRWVVRHSAGVTRYQHAIAGMDAGTRGVRRAGRSRQAGDAHAHQSHQRSSPASACSATSSGVWGRRAAASAASSSPSRTKPAVRCWRETRYNTEFGAAIVVLACHRARRSRIPAIARSSSVVIVR